MLNKGTASLEVKNSERNRELENSASLEPRVCEVLLYLLILGLCVLFLIDFKTNFLYIFENIYFFEPVSSRHLTLSSAQVCLQRQEKMLREFYFLPRLYLHWWTG